MEVLTEAGTVILVRMADEERVDVPATLAVALQPVTEQLCHIGGVVVGIVRRGSNVDVYQNPATRFGRDQYHVAVTYRKEHDFRVHCCVTSVALRPRAPY